MCADDDRKSDDETEERGDRDLGLRRDASQFTATVYRAAEPAHARRGYPATLRRHLERHAPALSADGDADVYVLRPNGVGVLIDCGTALHGEKDGHLLIFRRERG
jgi:hypothetical protein